MFWTSRWTEKKMGRSSVIWMKHCIVEAVGLGIILTSDVEGKAREFTGSMIHHGKRCWSFRREQQLKNLSMTASVSDIDGTVGLDASRVVVS